MEQQGGSYNRKPRWPTLDELRPKLKEASLMESALEDNSAEQVMQSPKKMISASSSSSSGSTAGSGRGPPSSSSVRMPVQNTNNRTNVHQFISQAGDSGHETLLSDDDSPTPAVERASSEVIYSTIANG